MTKIGERNMSWTNKKNLLINLTLILVSVLFSVLLAEVVLRIVKVDKSEYERVEHEILGHVAGEKGAWDDNGFRNKSVPEKVDIVAMGDSQTQGLNAEMDEAWPQALDSISDKTVYQMAFIERAIVQHYYLLDKALSFNPEYVLHGFYLGNDLLDAYHIVYNNENWKHLRNEEKKENTTESTRSEDVRRMIKSGQDSGSFKYKLRRTRDYIRSKSYFYSLLGNVTRKAREKMGLAETNEEKNQRIKKWLQDNPDKGYYYEHDNLGTIMSPTYRYNTVDLSNPDTKEGFAITKKLWIEMRDDTNEKEAEFVIVIIPTKEYVYSQYFNKEGIEIGEYLNDIIEKEKNVIEETKSFCLENNLPFIDVTEHMSLALSQGQKIYPESLDGHPLPEGYKRIAEAINNELLLKREE